MPTIINNRSTLVTDPLRNFRFLVKFKPLTGFPSTLAGQLGDGKINNITFGFTSVSGLSVTTDSIPYREGGYNTTVHQIPGQTTFTPLTLQRGVMLGTNQNWNWMRLLFATVAASGSTRNIEENFRCNIEIQVLSHPVPAAGAGDPNTAATDHIAKRIEVYNAWPTSVAYSDLNAGDNALLVEQATFVHEGFDINWATALSASAAGFGDAAPAAAGAGAGAGANAAV
jgi:phage tail-like protein